MLARSLIREVAPTDEGDSPSASIAAQATQISLAERMPGILCSPRGLQPDRWRHSHDGDPQLTMRGSCHVGLSGQCLDIAERSLKPQCRGGFITMGETAARRQILPGYLRIINHKEAKVPKRRRSLYSHAEITEITDAHLRTERHHAWIAREPHAANQLDRLLAAGNDGCARRVALGRIAQGRRQHRCA